MDNFFRIDSLLYWIISTISTC